MINKGYITSNLIGRNKSAEVFYREAITNEIQRFISKILEEIQEEYKVIKPKETIQSENSISGITLLLRKVKNSYLDIFTGNSEKIIVKFLNIATRKAKRSVKSNLERDIGKAIAVRPNYKAFNDALKLMIQQNVSLIKNVAEQNISNIENIVFDGMKSGLEFNNIEKQLDSQKIVAKKRIRRIAYDQTAKANASINYLEQQSAGIEYFEWHTIEDERTSTGFGGHKQLDGNIYKWNDENSRHPVIDGKGNRGLPSQRVNCRCWAKAVIIFQGYRAVWDSSAESYKIVKE